jgi:AcrR family transcriptional regulator
MPKKRGPEYEEKRAALRRAAARMLAESPFDIPSWPAVAAEIGMSQGAISYYYGNLRNLLWAVVSEHLRQLLERLGEEAPETMPARERIVALARSYAGVIRDHEPEHWTTMTHQLRLDPARSRDARQMQAWVLGLFEDAFAAALPRCAVGRAMPLALSLVSLLNGHAEWFREHKDPDRLLYAEMAARMVLSEAGPRRQRAAGLQLVPGVAGSSCNTLREAA